MRDRAEFPHTSRARARGGDSADDLWRLAALARTSLAHLHNVLADHGDHIDAARGDVSGVRYRSPNARNLVEGLGDVRSRIADLQAELNSLLRASEGVKTSALKKLKAPTK